MKTIQSIDRAMMILNYIAKHQHCRLVDMSQSFELNKSTLHGILMTLEYHGLIHKDSHQSTYTLGAKLFELGKKYEDNLSIKTIAKPYLSELASKFEETVHLGVLTDTDVLYIDKVESPHSLRLTSKVGTTDPLLTTASGKAILSKLPPNRLNDLLHLIEKPQANTHLSDYQIDIKKELNMIHDIGYALDLEEQEVGLNCIAAPITNRSNEAIASISISIPSSRFTRELIDNMKKELIITCKEISSRI